LEALIIRNMQFFFKILLVFLAIFLPFHGFVSVIFELLRYWKELVFFVLFLVLISREILNFGRMFECWNKHELIKNNKSFKFIKFDKAEFFSLLFLIWSFILVLINKEFKISLLAWRYLSFGVLVYLVFSRLFKFFPEIFNVKFLKKYFLLPFMITAVFAVLFGIWAKFFGGFSILENIYSGTISSWVPGQKIPIFHEVFGIARMQGGSSGPVEFGMMILIAFWIWIYFFMEELQTKKSGDFSFFKILLNSLVGGVLLFGIYQSYSRAILGGSLIFVFNFLWMQILAKFWKTFKNEFFSKSKSVKTAQILFLLIVLITSFKLLITRTEILEKFEEKFIERVGTTEHFTRPIQAFNLGFENIFIGNLGKLGPAARQQNLAINNSDYALIAENVFIDVFAQTGILGVVFYSLFLFFVFLKTRKLARILLFVIFLVANTATIFDMTPVAILVFFMLAIFSRDFKKMA